MANIGVVGVGAIGGYVAAALGSAGHDIVLCARRPFERLVVDTGETTLVVDRAALTTPSAASQVDWVLFATKVHQTSSASEWLFHLCWPRTAGVLVLQNGIGREAELAPLTRPVPVIPAVVLCGAELIAPGHVRHHGSATLRVPGSMAQEVEALFASSPITIERVEDFFTAAWQKLMMNVVSGPIGALTMRRLEVFREEPVAELARALANECAAVGIAAGARIDPDEGGELVRLLQRQPASMGNSMLYDRLAGRPTEHAALCGAVSEAGRSHGIPTPLNDALATLLAALEEGPDGSGPP